MCVPPTSTLNTVNVALTRVNVFSLVAPYVSPVEATAVSVAYTPAVIFSESTTLGLKKLAEAAVFPPVPITLTVKDSLFAVEVIDAVIVTVEVSRATFESVAALSVTAPEPVTAA